MALFCSSTVLGQIRKGAVKRQYVPNSVPKAQGTSFVTFAESFERKIYSIDSMRGALIVLEGVDRAGKSTQCQKLVDYLTASGVRMSG